MKNSQVEIADELSSGTPSVKQSWLELLEVSSHERKGRGEQDSFGVNTLPSTPSNDGKTMHSPAESSNDVRSPGSKKAKRDLVHSKFQERLIDFMDDNMSTGAEICNYMKIMTACLLVHTRDRDIPLSDSERSFFADAQRMLFDTTVHPPSPAKVVPNNSLFVLPVHNVPPPVPSMPSSFYQNVELGVPGGAVNSPIALDGEMDSDSENPNLC